MPARSLLRWPLALATAVTLTAASPALRVPDGPVDPRLLSALRWRNLGPFRAGRVAAVSGVVGQPGVFYIGLPAGGVWKTTSAGETWFPVMDDVREVSSIGAVEVAPGDANVVYAGTGDMVTGGAINEGNGVWASSDAGRTWVHRGLTQSKQIPSISVDPRDARTLLVAAQGDLRTRGGERGIYRSTDGGGTWTRTLYIDGETGIQRLARAYDTPDVVYATSVRHFQAPVPPGAPITNVPQAPPNDTARTGTALYKSTDNGVTWTELTGTGLPRLAGRTTIAVAMNTGARRVFLVANNGLFRSDDGGATWKRMAADDERIRNGQGGYNSGVYVDPKDPDVVYVLSTSSYRSTDGGNTFTGFKGAPGGDDPQQLWIDPTNGQRMLMGVDQGAIVSLDGGRTWSSWYNQSTEQVYHIAIDNGTPGWVYGTQQDAGAIRTRLRGNLGAITPLDWSPVPGWEWGTILPDPRDANTVYSSGSGIVKISYPSEQWINVAPTPPAGTTFRTTISQPIAFAPWNPRELIAGFQSLWSTTDAGATWKRISPDLTLPGPVTATTTGTTGAIESIALSPVGKGVIWTGAVTGVIKVSRDHGATWSDASVPARLPARRVNVELEASHFDAGTAYAALDYHYMGDYGTYLYRTRDFGRTWTPIMTGLPSDEPAGSFVRVVREDPVRRGLLFAGTESSLYVSFDDGDHWQSLRQNLPTTSYRDVAIRGTELVVATYGRGLWALDDISPLRQVNVAVASEPAHLFAPGEAVRLRRNLGADTPFPPEVPSAANPMDGVIIDYWLAQAAHDVRIDVLDARGSVVRHLSSAPIAPVAEAARPLLPNFWVATPTPLTTAAGGNRANWDLRHDAPPAVKHTFEINANPGLTPASPEGPLVAPGRYTLRLTADGHSYTQPVVVRHDPLSPASPAAIVAQHALQVKLADAARTAYEARAQAIALRASLARAGRGNAAVTAFGARLDTVSGVLDAARGQNRAPGAAAPPPDFTALNNAFVQQLEGQDYGDHAPTQGALEAWRKSCGELRDALARWERLRTSDLATLNATLGGAAVRMEGGALVAPACAP